MNLFNRFKKVTPMNDSSVKWSEIISEYKSNPVEMLAQAIVLGAHEGLNSYEGVLGAVVAEDSGRASIISRNIFLEFIFVFLDILDRDAYTELGEGGRNKLMDEIMRRVFSKAAASYYIGEIDTAISLIAKKDAEAGIEYSKTTSFSSADLNLQARDTAMSVLSARIVGALGQSSADYFTRHQISMSCWTAVQLFLITVDFKEWLKGPATVLGLRQYRSINITDSERQKRIVKSLNIR